MPTPASPQPDKTARRIFWIVAVMLAFDVLGALGWLHPRRCPACQVPYHRGQKCDWA